jgi:hypothetical protein
MLSATRRQASPRRVGRRVVAAVVYVGLAIAFAAAGDESGGIVVIVALVVTGAVAGYFIAEGWAPALAVGWLAIGVVVRDDETGVVGGVILALAPALVAAAALGAGVLIAKHTSQPHVRDD